MKFDIFSLNFEKDVRCLCSCRWVRVLHVRYSHAAAGTFGSHKLPAPEIYILLKICHIYHIYFIYI